MQRSVILGLAYNYRWLLVLVAYVAGFFLLTSRYSLMIPAWEANDEADHVANIEYEVKHFGDFVPVAYGRWHETHQPPLYYWLGAAWQKVLGIKAFTIRFPPWRAGKPENGELVFDHTRFNATQRKQAHLLHRIRRLAPILGATTVGLTFLICRAVTSNLLFASSATLITALHPKFLTLSAVVTNDSLAILLGCVLFLLLIYYVSSVSDAWLRSLFLSLGIGLTCGAGVIAKLNLLPMIGLLVPVAILLGPRGWWRRATNSSVIVLSMLLVSGRWLLHNQLVYGDWLALRASTEWLAAHIPQTMRPVSFLDSERFLNFVPETLFQTLWYSGDFNQWVAPFAFYLALWFFAAICLGSVIRMHLTGRDKHFRWQHALLTWLAALSGVIAVLLIARQTFQAEGRIAFVVLPAFALLLTSGSDSYFIGTRLRCLRFTLWPLLLLLLDTYVFLRFVLPFRGIRF